MSAHENPYARKPERKERAIKSEGNLDLNPEDDILIARVHQIMTLAREGHLSPSARDYVATNLHALSRVTHCLTYLLMVHMDAGDLMAEVRRSSIRELETKLSRTLVRTGNGSMTIRGLCRTLKFITDHSVVGVLPRS